MRFILLSALALAACAQDPMDRPGTWSLAPAGLDANNANLREMLVNPNDLAAGRGEDTSLGALAAPPVHLLETGRRRPLPAVNATTIEAAPAQQPSGSGGAGGGSQQ